jgi:hypothetical protein
LIFLFEILAGGISRAVYYQLQATDDLITPSGVVNSYNALISGYGMSIFMHHSIFYLLLFFEKIGFACFCYFVAFALAVSACFHISPLTHG